MNPLGEVLHLTYASEGLLTSQIDRRGNTHSYFYGSLGRLVRDENPAGGFISLTREETEFGHQIEKSNALYSLGMCAIGRSPAGEMTKKNTSPAGIFSEATIEPNGLWRRTNTRGEESVYQSGPDPRWGMQSPILESFTRRTPGGISHQRTHQRSFTFSDPGDPLSVQLQTDTVSRNGKTYTTVYDRNEGSLTKTTPEGRQEKRFASNGHLTQLIAPGLAPVNMEYDSHGRPSRTLHGEREVSFSYGVTGYLEKYTDALSLTTTLDTDALGRVTKITYADGKEHSYVFDAAGNVVSIILPNGAEHQFAYNSRNRLETYTPPQVGSEAGNLTYVYNAAGQLERMEFPDGRAVRWEFDEFGREIRAQFSEGAIEKIYDPETGNLSQFVREDGSRVINEYDGSIPLSQTWDGIVSGTVSQTYSDGFQLANRLIQTPLDPTTYSIEYEYDNDGLLLLTGDLTIQRHPVSGFIASSELSLFKTDLTFDQYGELVKSEVRFQENIVFGLDFIRDAGRRLVQLSETLPEGTSIKTFTYDLADNLIEVERDGVLEERYQYDVNGNRTEALNSFGINQATYDIQDRIKNSGDFSYEHDFTGQLVEKLIGSSGHATSYNYDEFGNLRRVTLPSGQTVEYVIDPINRRVGKKISGTLTQGFLYKDLINPIAEIDSSGQIRSIFVYGIRGHVPDYMIKGGRNYLIISDHVGSPRLVVDSETGEIVQQMDYDSFGNVLMDTNPGFQPFGFAGGLYDADTQLIRFGTRDYDPTIGRWTTKDPMLFMGSVGSKNLYAYVSNNPTNFTDPFGLDQYSDVMAEACLALDQMSPDAINVYVNALFGEEGFYMNAEWCIAQRRREIEENDDCGIIGKCAAGDETGVSPKRTGEMDVDSNQFECAGGPCSADRVNEVMDETGEEIDRRRKERETKKDCDGDGATDKCTTPDVNRERCEEGGGCPNN
jgi:RHS repeat-associated protein